MKMGNCLFTFDLYFILNNVNVFSFSLSSNKNNLICYSCLVCNEHFLISSVGHYDARARVLIRHVSCLLRVTQQQLEDFEETLGEKLREAGEESE